MTTETSTQWEARLRETAASLAYPETPDIAGAVQARLAEREERRKTPIAGRPRLSWGMAMLMAIVLLATGLLAVPGVRAAVIEFIRVGAIQIFLPEPTPQATEAPAGAMLPPTAVDLSASLFDPAKAVDLATARAAVNFPLKLPTYPPDLGEPDTVYIHDVVWPPTVVMVWQEPDGPDAPAQMSLYQIGAEQYAQKGAEIVEETMVSGQQAFWLQGPHYFRLENDEIQPWLFVDGNVLVWWSAEGMTYRLESHLTQAEAQRVAESLQPVMEE